MFYLCLDSRTVAEGMRYLIMPCKGLATRGALLPAVLREHGITDAVAFRLGVVVALAVTQEMEDWCHLLRSSKQVTLMPAQLTANLVLLLLTAAKKGISDLASCFFGYS